MLIFRSLVYLEYIWLALEGCASGFIFSVGHRLSAADKIGLSDISIKSNWSLRTQGKDVCDCD